jgi:hypothetical protein
MGSTREARYALPPTPSLRTNDPGLNPYWQDLSAEIRVVVIAGEDAIQRVARLLAPLVVLVRFAKGGVALQ